MSVHPDEGVATPAFQKTYTSPSSSSIVEDVKGGYFIDYDEAFIDIYKEFYAYAFFLSKAFVSAEDAPDMVASAFSKLWLKKNELGDIQYLKGYIRTVVRNTCMDHLSKESVRKREEGLYSEYFSSSSENDYFNEEASAEKLQHIYTELEKLPARCQEIFKLAYVQNLKNKDIARLLGITSRTVINQKSSALRFLRMTLLSFFLFIFF